MGKKDRGIFFTATPVKFVLLSLCTFGLYEFAWFYENWRRVRERTGRGLSPAWRATFPPLYAWPLFRDIDTAAQERGILQNLHPVVLTALYVLLWIPALMASPWKFIKLLTVVPLLMMNNLARRTCRAADPEWEENGRIGFGAMIDRGVFRRLGSAVLSRLRLAGRNGYVRPLSGEFALRPHVHIKSDGRPLKNSLLFPG